jgi:hypothetical protein
MTAKTLGEEHDRDYRRGADRWLLEIGEDAVFVTPDPGPLGKDADEILKVHDAEALRQLIEAAAPARLSPDGWVTKLAHMTAYEYDLKRQEFAKALGGIRLSTLDGMRKQGQAATGTGSTEDDAARSRLIAIAVKPIFDTTT